MVFVFAFANLNKEKLLVYIKYRHLKLTTKTIETAKASTLYYWA